MLAIQKKLNFIRLNLRHKDFIIKYKKIKKNQYLSSIENKKKQLSNLNNLLTHTYRHVPYYHKLFDGLDIVENNSIILKSLKDLVKIPLLTKEIISSEGEQLYSDDIHMRAIYKNSSGGSTGKPVTFIQDSQYAMSNRVNTQLTYSWRGFGLYDDMVVIWGAERDIFEGGKSFKRKLVDFVYNRKFLNSFSMSDNDMRDFIECLNRERPKLIKAYVQSIYEISKFAKKNNIKVEAQKAIHLAAGTVYESMRVLIEEVFQCKAYNDYGSREVGSIASECGEQDGLHIMMEHTLVEVLNKKGNPCQVGESGEIVVTSLANYAMPLIRYKIGDIGVVKADSECGCGCSYPKLEKVVGRTTDIFTTMSGDKVDGEYFTHLFYFRDWIEKFQVVQDSLDEITIKIVLNSNIVDEEIMDIERKIKLVMGEVCKVAFIYVNDIPKTITGKYRYTISRIES